MSEDKTLLTDLYIKNLDMGSIVNKGNKYITHVFIMTFIDSWKQSQVLFDKIMSITQPDGMGSGLVLQSPPRSFVLWSYVLLSFAPSFWCVCVCVCMCACVCG